MGKSPAIPPPIWKNPIPLQILYGTMLPVQSYAIPVYNLWIGSALDTMRGKEIPQVESSQPEQR